MLLYGISTLCFLLAGYCGILSIGDRVTYGAWYPPQWTIGGTFGINESTFGSLGAAVAGWNAGWLFLALMFLSYFLALQRK